MLKVMKIYHIITGHSSEEDILLKTMRLVLEMHFVFENGENIFNALLEQTKVHIYCNSGNFKFLNCQVN